MTKIRRILAAALFLLASPLVARAQYFQHVSLSPSHVQGELFTGAMKTNKGVGQVTLLPVFFRNAAASDPWYRPSFAPLVVGGGAGGGNTNLALGSVLDVGPQLIMGFEGAVGLFSAPAKTRVEGFFNCSASATACAALSAGVLANLNLEEDGRFSDTWKALGRHPVGYFIGPSLLFGGSPVAAVRR
ncbi:MAG: hypothetical protein PHS14_00160 [Elusimicrobia bacterium]|nr:hypothetical protein [Elusimicrobiota bacterium]